MGLADSGRPEQGDVGLGLHDGGLRLEHLRARLLERGVGAFPGYLVIAGVELDEQVALVDALVIVYP